MAPGGMNILPGAFFWRYRDFENNNIRDYGNANFNDDHEIFEYFRKPDNFLKFYSWWLINPAGEGKRFHLYKGETFNTPKPSTECETRRYPWCPLAPPAHNALQAPPGF